MTAIIVIIAFVAFVSLLDYGLFQRWQMSTSTLRNEVVFEKRNREFGAYVIRNEYDRNLVKIMVFLFGSIGLLFGGYLVFKSKPIEFIKPSLQTNETIVDIIRDNPKPDVPEKEPQKQKQNTSQSKATNTQPVIIDQTVIKPITVIDSSAVGSGKVGVGDPFGNGMQQQGGQTGSGSGTGGGSTQKPPADIVDIDAAFPGGYVKMMEFIQSKLIYPSIGIEIGAQGKCYVKFVIDENGKISNVKVVRGVPNCPECDTEAIRVVKSMPEWIPGKIKGESVSSFFMLPIIFALE